MPHIILVEVGRSNVGSATKPPNAAIRLEVTVVEMHGWTVGVARVHDAGKTAGEEGNTFSGSHTLRPIHSTLGRRLQCLLGHRSVDDTEVDTGLFKHGTVFEDAGHTPTSVGASPAIFLEGGLAVNFLNCASDGDLSLADHFLESGAHGVVAIRAIAGTNKGVGRLFHGLVRIPSNIHRRSIFCLLSIRFLVSELSSKERTLECLLFEGRRRSSFNAGGRTSDE
mmetsp:Transcript_46490/g.97677  ORF Transcript_46490/g.97677 Transcript_46490/m.97677 type:complete len:224 (+) Transcript_46490:573-1244(+)